VFLSAAILALEAVLYLDLPSGGVVAGSLFAACCAALSGLFLQRLEYRVDRPFARWLAEFGFVVVPAVPVVLRSGWLAAAEVSVLNASLLAVYAFEERLGLRFVLVWAARFAWANLREGWRSLWRIVPLLALVLLALFFAAETWQVASHAGPGGLFVFGLSFTGFSMLIGGFSFGATGYTGLRRSERFNVAALAAVANGVFSVFAAFAFSVVLLVMGVLLVRVDVLEAWLGREVSAVEFDFLVKLTFSWELLATVSLVAVVAVFVFSAALGSSDAYRDLSTDAVRAEIEPLLRDREEYLRLCVGRDC